jgi:acetyl esterase/lipase
VTRTGVRYGRAHAQVAEIWRPPQAAGALPVVALLHGGFWRPLYTKRLMQRMAAAVVAHGWAAYNIEYRRVGRFGGGGWPATFEDVHAAVDALAEVDGIDLHRVVTCGHSAGGHLAMWAGSTRTTATARTPVVPVRAAISLAGVVDLDVAARLGLGGGAVPSLMGGDPEERPTEYALGSPAALLPIGIPQLLVHGLDDTTVPPSLSSNYADLASARGDDASYVGLAGAGHMDMIDPRGAAFLEVTTFLDRFSS